MGRGQAGGAQSSSARDMKMFLRNRMWHDHYYILSSASVLVVVLFVSAFLQFYTSEDHVYRLDVADAALMDRVFRSGEPWVVLCSSPDDVLPEVFNKVSPRLAGKIFVGVLDCKQKLLASGKSVLKRYGIKTSITPTVFTVANGEKPKQVFLKYLQTSAALAKYVKAQTKKTMQQVQNSAQLETRCLSRLTCVLFLRGQRFQLYEKQWIDKLMRKHRTLSFAWIDSASLKLSIESMLPDVERGEHRLILFQRQHDSTTHKTVLAAKAYRGGVLDATSVGMFLGNHVQGDDSLKPLTKFPKVLHRRKKIQTLPSEQGDSEHGHTKRRHHHRHKEHGAEEEKGDEYYFPQQVEPEADGETTTSVELDDAESEVDVLNLDDE